MLCETQMRVSGYRMLIVIVTERERSRYRPGATARIIQRNWGNKVHKYDATFSNPWRVIVADNKISIITVCLNCEELIERTVRSVIEQTYANVQYIVIDGGSTDNTLSTFKGYEDAIDVLLSEEDKGIYDAMNKGLNYASGDLIYYLNAGDYLYNNDVLRDVIERLSADPSSDILCGDFIYYDNNNEQRRSGYRANIPDLLYKGFCHQTIFAKRSSFVECGKFNEDYKIFADYDWLLRALVKYRQKMSYIGIPIAYFLGGGESDINADKYDYERIEIMHKNVNYWELLSFALSYPIPFSTYLLSLSRYNWRFKED